MAFNLQNLLGFLPLQNMQKKNNLVKENNPFGQNIFGMESPINTNLNEQVGMNQLSPINQQMPNYFSQQMYNTGLENPYNIQLQDTTTTTEPATQSFSVQSIPIPGTIQQTPYQSSNADLMNNFFSGIGGQYGQQLTDFTGEDSEGGINLTIRELAQLAGFVIPEEEYKANQLFNQLRQAGIMAYAEKFLTLPDKLRNAQEFRTMKLGEQQREGARAYKSLLDYAAEGSISGLESGRRTAKEQETTKGLEEALRTQLLGAEASYVSELDSLLNEYTSGFSEALYNVATDAVTADPSLGTYLRGQEGSIDETGDGPSEPLDYTSLYQQYNLNQSDINQIQMDMQDYYSQFGYYPTMNAMEQLINAYLQANQDKSYG